MDSPTDTSPLSIAPLVLVAETAASRASLRRCLEGAGYGVVEAAAAAHALAYLHFAAASHLVVLDFQVFPGTAEPLLHVVELDASLRRHRYLLTHDESIKRFSAEAQRLIHALCTDVMVTPVDETTLLDAVKRAMAPSLALARTC